VHLQATEQLQGKRPGYRDALSSLEGLQHAANIAGVQLRVLPARVQSKLSLRSQQAKQAGPRPVPAAKLSHHTAFPAAFPRSWRLRQSSGLYQLLQDPYIGSWGLSVL